MQLMDGYSSFTGAARRKEALSQIDGNALRPCPRLVALSLSCPPTIVAEHSCACLMFSIVAHVQDSPAMMPDTASEHVLCIFRLTQQTGASPR